MRQFFGGRIGDLPACGIHFVKLGFDSLANASAVTLTVGHATDVGRVKSQLFRNAGEKPSLCHIGAK